MPVTGSNTARRSRPESTTMRMPSMVRLVSAMFVASTTLRRPGGGGRQRRVLLLRAAARRTGAGPACLRANAPFCSCDCTRRISRAPGRNTSTSPASSLKRPPHDARASATRPNRRSAAAARQQRRGWCRHSRGCHRPGARPADCTTGASPSFAAMPCASSVADITSSFSSGARFACASSVSARPRSACRLRSWNSSNMTRPTPSSAASCCNMRVSTPSVTTSMRVSRETRVSMRMR